MPIEQNDNTRVVIQPIQQVVSHYKPKIKPRTPDQLYDKDRVDAARRAQNLVNNNALFGYGISGVQTNYDPHTQRTQIYSNLDYAKSNAENFVMNLAVPVTMEGAGQAIRYVMTPVEIGNGAEAIVTARPFSSSVVKHTNIPRRIMHIKNQVPGAEPARFTGTENGFMKYVQSKVKILSPEEWRKALPKLDRLMSKNGWQKLTHPNLYGPAYTNGRVVVSDLGPGNIGKNWFGQIRIPDMVVETVPEFYMNLMKKGGKL